MFRALLLDKAGDSVIPRIADVDDDALPEGDVTVAIEYSSFNYKDGLIVSGAGGLVKRYPHVPGIDFAGRVLESRHHAYRPGDAVILTGWRVGESRWGGFATRARVDGDWLVPMPRNLSTRTAMAIGTAGLTAMLALMQLEQAGLTPAAGDVLVTGAAGGVGSIATTLLATRGYTVVASTGRLELTDYLSRLGAARVIDRSAFADPAQRPLESERWAACIDSVGGNPLARVLAQCRYGSSVAAVGLAAGSRLEHTVIPFLLRGVSLLGVDSVMCPLARRVAAWTRLSEQLPLERLDAVAVEAQLVDVPELASEILKGRTRGRVIIDVNG